MRIFFIMEQRLNANGAYGPPRICGDGYTTNTYFKMIARLEELQKNTTAHYYFDSIWVDDE